MTTGRGTFTTEHAGYDAVPDHMAGSVLAQYAG
jgi:hypothetical protein